MAGDALQHLTDVEEIRIGFRRPDGSIGSTPVWVVRAGDDLFVRSMYGTRGGWYRRLRANPDGHVQDQAHTHPVRVEPVTDAGTVVEVTRADPGDLRLGDAAVDPRALTKSSTLRVEVPCT